MKFCPYCGFSNLEADAECRKCGTSLQSYQQTLYKSYRFGPEKAREFRKKMLGYFVLGLMIKVYWGGYGNWPVFDNDLLVTIRAWLQPILLYGGAAAYVLGWVMKWI